MIYAASRPLFGFQAVCHNLKRNNALRMPVALSYGNRGYALGLRLLYRGLARRYREYRDATFRENSLLAPSSRRFECFGILTSRLLVPREGNCQSRLF